MIESDKDLEVSVAGAPVKDHMISAGFFGNFLRDVQEVNDRVTFAAGASTPITATISENKLAESHFNVVAWHASLFTVQFKLTPIEEIEDFTASQRRTIALNDLRILFDDNTQEQTLTSLITRSASKSAYKRLLRNVADQKATVKLRTRVSPYGVTLSADVAAYRAAWMETPEREPQKGVFDVIGILRAGDLDKKNFRIKAEDSSYKGTVSKDAQDQMRIELGTVVRARLERITKFKTKASSRPTISYILQSIHAIPAHKQEDMFDQLKD
jgi:hypothetical protein